MHLYSDHVTSYPAPGKQLCQQLHMRSSSNCTINAHWLNSLGILQQIDGCLKSTWYPASFPQHCSNCQGIKALAERAVFILTGHWSHCDHEGSAPWFRLSLHFKKAESRVFPRTWVHGVKFLLVGQTCVRARRPSKCETEQLFEHLCQAFADFSNATNNAGHIMRYNAR